MVHSIDLDLYAVEGYIVLHPVVGPPETAALRQAAHEVAEARPEATLRNKGDGSLRIVYGVHQRSNVHARFVRLPVLLDAATRLLDGDVYVHQTKVTLNTPMTGEGWPWHQDYAFWSRRDHVPRPDVVSAAVPLDDMSAVNGPLLLVPRSHRAALPLTEDGVLSVDQIDGLCRANGIVAAIASAGSAVFFHGNVVHASSPNVTPFPRRVLYITYNRVDNQPSTRMNPPPDYLSSRDTAALVPLARGEPLLAA